MSTTTINPLPSRSGQQRLDALRRANAIRSYRAELKGRLKRGELAPAQVLLSGDERLESMQLLDPLLAVPKVGRVKAARVLREAGVSPSRSLGALSPARRAEILALIGGRR